MINLQNLSKNYPHLSYTFNRMPSYVSDNSFLKHYNIGDCILNKGGKPDHVYLFCNGSINVQNHFENGKYYILEENASLSLFNNMPDFIGSLAILAEAATFSITVTANSACQMIKIPRKYFLKWYNDDIELVKSVALILAKYLYKSTTNTGFLISHSVLYLLTRYIISTSSLKKEAKNLYVIPETRQALADHFCVTVRTINRNIKKLKEDNYISVANGKITFNNQQLDRLKKFIETID